MIRNRYKIYLIAILAAVSVGCTTTRLSVNSFPEEAEVWVKPLNQGEFEMVGKTPLQLHSENLGQKHPGLEALVVEIRKEGFRPHKVYITEVNRIDLSLNAKLSPQVTWNDTETINHVVETLFEVRRLVDSKKHRAALSLISKLKADFPHISAIHELEGGIYLLQGKHWAALDSYSRAAEYNPSNTALAEVVKQIQRYLNVPERTGVTPDILRRLPTSSGKEKEGSE